MSDEIKKTEDDLDLDYAKDIRKRLIEATFKDKKVPVDNTEAKILLDSLTALERVAIAKKRIKTDNEKNQSMAAVAIELARVIREEVDPSKQVKGDGEIPEFPPESLEGFDIPEFETSEYKEMDYDEFKKKNG